jgi:predicted nucleic acid-binding protein
LLRATAAQSLAEVYATLTRYPGKQRLSSEYAALLVQEIEHRLTLIWLDGDDYRAAIGNIAKMGIVGRAAYDRLVAACALKAGAHRLYTWNLRHFQLLGVEIQKVAMMPPAL